MLVIDSGRLVAKIGEGVPGMRPGLLYVKVAPSPEDCSAKPPNVVPPPMSLLLSVLVWADALAPTPARNATPTSATRTRLCRRTGDLPTPGRRVAGDWCGGRLARRTSAV